MPYSGVGPYNSTSAATHTQKKLLQQYQHKQFTNWLLVVEVSAAPSSFVMHFLELNSELQITVSKPVHKLTTVNFSLGLFWPEPLLYIHHHF